VKGIVVWFVLHRREEDRADFCERVTRRQRELIIGLADTSAKAWISCSENIRGGRRKPGCKP